MKGKGYALRFFVLMIILLSVFSMFAACSIEKLEKESELKNHTSATTPTETSEETEPQITTQGKILRDQCERFPGIYIAYEDGSFDNYPGGGYCEDLTRYSNVFEGMFLPERVANATPEVNGSTKLVVFASDDYYVQLNPIHAEVSAFSMVTNGVPGYGRLLYTYDDYASIYVYYTNGEYTDIDAININGKPAKEYQEEQIVLEVNPYRGMTSVTKEFILYGFVGQEVTLSVAEGSKLVDTTYTIDTIYYDCNYEHNNWTDEDVFYLKTMPTTEGYAVIDFTDIPSGRYVMLFRSNGKYKASLLCLNKG